MSKKIVFFDIDGTLAINSRPASPAVCRAIGKLRANGHYAVINTGRARSYVYPEILDAGFDGVVCAAGACVEFGGKVVCDERIPEPLLNETVRRIVGQGIGIVLEGTNGIFALNESAAVPPDIPRLEDFAAFERISSEIGVNKYTYYLQNSAQMAPIMPFLEKYYDLIIHNPERYGEIVPKGVSKATGMYRLMDFLGIDKSGSYAIGDSLNDLDMIRAAGCGIAMGNAAPQVLAAADVVTDSFENDGVAVALRQVGLI